MSLSKKTERNEKKKLNETFLLIIVVVILGSMAALFLINALKSATSACASAFNTAYNKTKEDTYNAFYQAAYDYLEHTYHLSNKATISIGNIKEENALEVLKVSTSWCQIVPDKDSNEKTGRWVLFNGSGVYTVDLRCSEFFVDNDNRFILIKLPTPKLNHIHLDGNTKIYKCDREGWGNGDFNTGHEMYMSDKAEAQINITQKLENNDENLSKAKSAAESLVKNLIKSVNQDLNLKDSEIQIEFI